MPAHLSNHDIFQVPCGQDNSVPPCINEDKLNQVGNRNQDCMDEWFQFCYNKSRLDTLSDFASQLDRKTPQYIVFLLLFHFREDSNIQQDRHYSHPEKLHQCVLCMFQGGMA